MDSMLIGSLVELSEGTSSALILWTGYVLLKATRTLSEHDKRISKLEWESNNG
ncbi:hypothetical protein [Vibrio scophthalmi]|uniref:Uncharacterized protein n=1 Tax=Vibrio scophthalmi TaxID=45658 RepID=A0A1E3WK86_9VIBR|nr:hypothetical protein [Vibrio scophthalmi]ODS10168.1 hypothetical protein VSF3289_00423 [Vibrio scophthalmi]